MKFKAPADASSITYLGKEHEVEDGFVNLPADAAETVKAHGFTPVADEPTAKKAKDKK